MSAKKELTPEEALAIVLKQRERSRKYQREYLKKPGVREKNRKKRREFYRKLVAGYAAAKKAGLI